MEYLEIIITSDPESSEIIQAFLAEADYDSFMDTDTGFNAYIAKDLFNKDELKAIQMQFPFTFTIDQLPDKNWNEEWERNFQPIVVEDKCQIRTDFHPSKEGVAYDIIITPKMSFGTGHHPTTYMMVRQLFDLPLTSANVLDMGCGTLVLAILAKKLGCNDATGIDNDEWAVNNAIENAERNGYSDIKILHGDAGLLSDVEKFDVILANINRNILVADMHAYAGVLKEGGVLVCSGFYTEDNEIIQKTAEENDLLLTDQNERENWSLLQFKKGT